MTPAEGFDTAPPLSLRLRAYYERDARPTWRSLALTAGLLAACWLVAFAPAPLGARVPCSIAVAALLLRLCSFGHDWAHGAILVGSRAARVVVSVLGVILLSPVRSWSDSHNHHHRHNGLLSAPAVGSFPLWTRDAYRQAGAAARIGYRLIRSPIAMLLAWPLVFLVSINLLPFCRDPRRYASSGAALALHAGLHAAALSLGGVATWLFAVAIPYALLGAAGAYLFYVQHNFPGARYAPEAEWTQGDSASSASSYLGLPSALHWVTGAIGYHHIHHLDPRVPHYRLREVHAREPELHRPPDTTLAPRDVARALSLAVWDERAGRMLTWNEL